jgi:hypothetical protein
MRAYQQRGAVSGLGGIILCLFIFLRIAVLNINTLFVGFEYLCDFLLFLCDLYPFFILYLLHKIMDL